MGFPTSLFGFQVEQNPRVIIGLEPLLLLLTSHQCIAVRMETALSNVAANVTSAMFCA